MLSDVQSDDTEQQFSKPSEEENKTKAVDYSNIKILLAEDNRINQKVMEKMIEQLGAKIDIAEDGEKAIEAVEQKSYDLIFMDMQMPKMDGLEATRKIRAMKLQKAPYIIALTANVLGEDIQKCLDAGMDEYLGKPIKIDSLKRLLQKIF
jgi:CheY-like chemotaxis protein